MRRRQQGTTTVEFAIVGLLALIAILGVIEFGRALFVINTLSEVTRRGARLAAVCPVGDLKPASAAVFDSGGGGSAVIGGLTTANIQVQYLDSSGTPLPNPAGTFSLIRYVRVRIVGFNLPLVIPTLATTLALSGFSTTLPRESLGIPRAGTVQPC